MMIAPRLRNFGSSIFAEMTAIAQQTGAINLGQGFPDTDGPAELLAAAVRAIDTGHNQYPPVRGVPELRAGVAADRLRHGTAYDPDTEVLITTGATCGLAAALLALCHDGDEVLVFDPCYDSYAACAAMAGATLRPVRLHTVAGRFTFDRHELRAAVTPRTRLLLLNSPHNPTGKVFTTAELEQIATVCREHDLIAITDEVYEHLVYDGGTAGTLAALPGMRERTLVVSSAAKTFSVTGWKVGWACGPADIVAAAQVAHQFLVFNSGTPFQLAVAEALSGSAEWVVRLRDSLAARRDLLSDGLAEAGLTVLRSEGTYYVQADVTPWGYDSGEQFCRDLPHRAGVVAVPVQPFYQGSEAPRTLVRFAYCKRPEILENAVRRLVRAGPPNTPGRRAQNTDIQRSRPGP